MPSRARSSERAGWRQKRSKSANATGCSGSAGSGAAKNGRACACAPSASRRASVARDASYVKSTPPGAKYSAENGCSGCSITNARRAASTASGGASGPADAAAR